jgi:hypothetical protein
MFKCKNCGHVESAEQAGECSHPHACSACGAGITYNPKTGAKVLDASNWEVLSGALPNGLKELVQGKQINVSVGNKLGLKQSTQ